LLVNVSELMRMAPVIPVLTIDDAAHARPIADALVAGGLNVIEVTLRTEAAFDAIAEMAKVKGAIVGAGTVLSGREVQRSLDAGARFLVSPGLTEPLVEAAVSSGMPFLPGVATASDIMRGMSIGLTHFKFFPAEAAGGIGMLKSLAAPFRQCRFCPTGGITAENAPAYLALDSVLCVGGSWIVARGKPDIRDITARAREAANLHA
jgi:2-dehydro-3-deoxyphosphogluconate aldolase/(4S)-4-hydroxy-2-oxoglutarate aldolase